ncbi:MAG: dTMP kinase [Bacillota bacterium]|jgi:dTMP kinase
MFITLEGPDGSGKTTQIKLLADWLRQAGYSVLQTREPGGTLLGEQVRTLVLAQGQMEVAPLTEMLLIAAARAQHVQQVLRPQLSRFQIVISDRYIDSSLVYQGHALGLGWEKVRQVNEVAIDGLWPDLTILLMLTPAEAYNRSVRPHETADRIESRGLAYYESVCAGYELLAKRYPQRVQKVDAAQSVATVQQSIRHLLSAYLK